MQWRLKNGLKSDASLWFASTPVKQGRRSAVRIEPTRGFSWNRHVRAAMDSAPGLVCLEEKMVTPTRFERVTLRLGI